MTQIKNEFLTVTIDPKGGTLTSIVDNATGREYMWQGDPAIWAGQAPNLFPFVGRLKDETYTLNGKAYKMIRHGFVRGSVMELEAVSESSCTFALSDSEEIRAIYPFTFTFRIVYTLVGRELKISFQAQNRGTETMYCGMGGHPGFNVPMDDGLSFEDYEITFPEPCHPHQICFSPSLQVAPQRPDYALVDDCRLPLNHDLFSFDAVVLADTPRCCTLHSTKGQHGVKVTYPSMGYVGFWHMPKTTAPYLCIEPWATLPGRDGIIEELSEYPDAFVVPAGETVCNDWSVEIW